MTHDRVTWPDAMRASGGWALFNNRPGEVLRHGAV